MTSTITIPVRRMDGSRATVQITDATHYEVDIWMGDDLSEDEQGLRHELVIAETAPIAKRLARRMIVAGERVEGARKLSNGEVAVAILNGAHAVR